MFPIPSGWKLARSQPTIVLVSDGASIVVEEGLRPLQPVARLAHDLPIEHFSADTIEHVTTCEGELAALVRGSVSEKQYRIGFVLLDDNYIRVIGQTMGDVTALESAVRHVVIATRVFLGSPRRRRFYYEPPPSWQRLEARNGDETWLAPDYPAERASLSVPRALPASARAQVSIVTTLLGLTELPAVPPTATPITARSGLSGRRWTRMVTSEDNRDLEIVVVALTDDRYDYFLRFIAPRGLAQEIFAAVVASVEPITAVANAELDVMAMWVT